MSSHADEAAAWLSDKQPAMEDALAPLVDVNSFTENREGGRKVGTMLRDLFAAQTWGAPRPGCRDTNVLGF